MNDKIEKEIVLVKEFFMKVLAKVKRLLGNEKIKKTSRVVLNIVGVIAVIFIAIRIPIITEKIIYGDFKFPSDLVSGLEIKISRNVWFSFVGSYIGAVVTLIVMFFTISYTNMQYRKNLMMQYRNFEIEKEIELAKNVKDLLLLNNYNFFDVNKYPSEFSRYKRDFFDNQNNIARLIFNNENITYKDKFYSKLHEFELLQATYLSKFLLDTTGKSAAKNLEILINYINAIKAESNNKREELNKLYQEYYIEMNKEKYKF